MKSPMVQNSNYISNKPGYSDLQVLESPAGFYIGTIYTGEDGLQEPGSRDSDYFSTREDAEQELRVLTALGNKIAGNVLRKKP